MLVLCRPCWLEGFGKLFFLWEGMYLLVKSVIRAESLSLLVIVWYQEPKWEVTARSAMGKCSVVKHPSTILPKLETPQLPLAFEYFDLFYLFSDISEQIVGKSSSSFQTCAFLWLSYLGKLKRKNKLLGIFYFFLPPRIQNDIIFSCSE